MDTAPSGMICTGLQWWDGRASLAALDGGEVRHFSVEPGARIGWRWSGPRRCLGWWSPADGRQVCPASAAIGPAARLAQCEACQNRDYGLSIARDRITDDGRTYQVYLAWFAPGMLKVGISAVQRGSARLLEQGAIGYTVIASGPLPSARRAELTLSGAGLAKERYRSRAKVEAWWRLPDTLGLRAELEAAREKALRILADHAVEHVHAGPIIDNSGLFGLADGAPAAYDDVAELAESGAIGGVLAPPVGKHLLLTADGRPRPVLLDTRLLAGRLIEVDDGAVGAGCEGLRVVECRRPVLYDTPMLF